MDGALVPQPPLRVVTERGDGGVALVERRQQLRQRRIGDPEPEGALRACVDGGVIANRNQLKFSSWRVVVRANAQQHHYHQCATAHHLSQGLHSKS